MGSVIGISAGDYQATVDVVGAGLHSLAYRGADLVASYDAQAHGVGEPAPHCSGSILAPWPNRTADGAFYWSGQQYRVAITEPERGNANHGVVLDKRWEVVAHTARECVLSISVGPGAHQAGALPAGSSAADPSQPGAAGVSDPSVAGVPAADPSQPGAAACWPWDCTFTATYSLDPNAGLTVELQATNLSDQECPIGVGFHPYLMAMGAPLDECTLRVDVAECVELSPDRLLPTGRTLPVDGLLPLAAQGLAQPMAGIQLDHCFGGRRGGARLINAQGEGVELHAGPEHTYFQIFTADPALGHGYPGIGRAVAVEPQTCPPNMLNTGCGRQTLRPGQARTFTYRLSHTTDTAGNVK